MIWRAKLLEFVLETRNIIKLSKEAAKEKEKEDTLKNLIFQLQDRFLPGEGGVAVTNTDLRENLVSQLQEFRSHHGRGLLAQGNRKGESLSSRSVTSDHNYTDISVVESSVSVSSVVSLLQEVYLDPGVWDKLDKLYLQFLHKNPTLPTLAVLLSIL